MLSVKAMLPIIVMGIGFCGLAECVSDEEIATRIVLANSYVDDGRAAARDMRYAIGLCGSDSNRLCRIVRGIAETNANVRHVGTAMRMLTRYGTPAQLPYLYSVSTNSVRGAEAVKAILRIEGVTTNSILAVSNCLAQASIDDHERYLAFRNLIESLYRLNPDDSCRVFGLSYVQRHVLTANEYCLGVDYELKKHDSTYGVSKRRLAVLRSVCALEINDFQRNAVTNAINELVAYPEANLPE